MESVKLQTGETLEYDHAAHLYTIDGSPCTGTHKLMEKFDIVKPLDQWGAPYAERGRRVDFYTEAWDQDDLDREDVDSSERGYLDAWVKFKEEHDVRIGSVQMLVGSAQLWYATTIDRGAAVDGTPSIINLKTGQIYPKPHRIQAHLESILVPDAERVLYVYLAPDGTYDVQDYTDDYEARKTATAIAQANGMAHAWMKRRKKAMKV